MEFFFILFTSSFLQIKSKHENMILQTIPATSSSNREAKKPALPTTQAIKVRGVLEDQ